VVLIFSNGKAVVLGCKTLDGVHRAVDVVERKLDGSAAVEPA
jgi:TATA-box binding protein (TBP) (component of TFIID and TFIIIB)